MKSYLKKTACLSALIIPFSLQAVSAGAYWKGNIKYEIWGDEAVICGFKETERAPLTDIVIPAEIDGHPVTFLNGVSIGKMPDLVSVTIPDSVTRIGTAVFHQCPKLEKINIPDSVTIIQNNAFRDCPSLYELDIPESVTRIDAYAFENTGWMKERLEENPLVTVNHILINGRTCTGDITIPETVHTIGASAFEKCSDLKKIILPENVDAIESDAFRECTDLESITIENPYCQIELHDGFIISNGYDILDDGSELEQIFEIPYYHGVIRGYENSTAQAYAESHGYQFELIETVSKTGDADGDGKADILDVITLNKAIMGKETLSETSLKAIDLNQNGKPDSEEALTILKYIVGLITELS